MQKRIIISVVLSAFIILSTLGVVSYLSVGESIERSMSDHLVQANIISKYIEDIIRSNLTRLYDISISGKIDFNDGNWSPEKKALRSAYEYSIFTDRIFLLDKQGNAVLKYPHQEGRPVNLLSNPYVRTALTEQKQVISDVYTIESTGRRVIYTLVPLKDRNGDMVGIAGGEINPTNYIFSQIIKSIPMHENSSVELIDSFGTIIASDNPQRTLITSDHNEYIRNMILAKKPTVEKCHRCHEGSNEESAEMTRDIMAFSPLTVAPWGVTVRDPEDIVFAPARKLKGAFLLIGAIFLIAPVLLAFGVTRSIVHPLQTLIGATQRIGKGNLDEPININSSDEIGVLAKSFEEMRMRLDESLSSIRDHNVELERRVFERTKELRRSRYRLSKLLDMSITAQEEERKRVARELHDETSQSLAALGMSIDIAELAFRENELKSEDIRELKQKLEDVLDGTSKIIRDLRPPVLDDLGFEAGVRWLLERNLGEKDIKYTLSLTSGFKKVFGRNGIPDLSRGKVELMLFRVIQEAVQNISKHSKANDVSIFLCASDTHINIGIDDNGAGFDVKEAMGPSEDGKEKGYGILGMKERIALLDGEMYICSDERSGTFINIDVPLSVIGVIDE
ncbi:MAG: HAMP domain-containing protein [Nitrospirota bacterium]|nr:MAG: HAMP domain-containing protein [Nitrospirota bacterium]